MHPGDQKPKVYLYRRNRVAHIVILVSYCVQIAKCRVLENFQGLKVRGQGQGLGVQGRGRGQGLVNWSSRIFEDEDFPRGQQLWPQDTSEHALPVASQTQLCPWLHGQHGCTSDSEIIYSAADGTSFYLILLTYSYFTFIIYLKSTYRLNSLPW